MRVGRCRACGTNSMDASIFYKVKEESKDVSLWAALQTDSASLTIKMLHKSGAELIFDAPVDVEAWNRRFKSKQVHLQMWQYVSDTPGDAGAPLLAGYSGNGLIAVAARRNERLSPIGDATRIKKEDQVYFFVFESEVDAAGDFLNQNGWQCMDRIDKDGFTTSTCRIETVGS